DDQANPIPNHKVYFSILDGSATLDAGELLVEVRTNSAGYAAAEVTTGMMVELSHIQVNAFRAHVDLVGSPYTFGCYASTPDEYLEPLTPSSSFVGTQSNERAGYHLHTAGDVNGDGYDDFMIGTFHFKGENGGIPGQYDQNDTGAAYLILGKAVPNWGTDFSLDRADARFIGHQSYRSVGFYLAGGGDVNGDGYDDMIIGAPAGNDARATYEGSVFLVFGKASGDWAWDSKLYDMADASFDGENGQDNAGYSVAHIGDMNNDGYDDFIASAPFTDNVREDDGSVYLFLGKAGGWSRQVGVENAAAIFKGNARHGAFGYCVDGVGDVNDDGVPDFVVGERGTGKVYLYFGRPSVNWGRDALASATADVVFSGPEYTGFRVSRAGDVNGDGMNDILIGSIKADGSAGKTYLIWGRSDGSWDTDLENADVAFAGEITGDESSWDVQDAGDVNNDGFDDFMIGAWLNEQNGLQTGKMYLVKGKPFGWESEVQLSSVQEYFVGEHPVDRAGFSVARAGDINGDGWQDLLTSSAWADGEEPNSGIVYLFNNPSGIPMPPILAVDPDTMQFGNVYNQLEFVVRNVGGEMLNWTAAEDPDETWLYSITPTSGAVASGDSQIVAVNVSRMGLANGIYYGNISVTDGDGISEAVTVEMIVAPTPEYSVRLNAGGTDYTDIEGNLWGSDRAYSVGRYGYVGGQTYGSSDPISGTSDDPLYQSERYGMSAYQFDVSPGSYSVTLLFAETYHQAVNRRVMSVSLENQVALEELDIYAQAGHDAAFTRTFDNVIVADGRLDISFAALADDPKVSAIYITSNSTVSGMTVEPDSLDFGFDDVALSLTVTNDGDVPLDWSAIELPEASWITGISPASGTIAVTGQQQVTISVSRAGLSKGDYSAGVRISSNAGLQDIPVLMSVSGLTELAVDPEELAFSTSQNSMSFTITNIGKETFNWVAMENPEQIWITQVSPASGQLGISQSAVVTVDVNRFGLEEGTYGSFIQVLAAGTEADTAQVAVSMDVTSYRPYTQRINAGGNGYTDTAGNFWAADQAYTAGGFGYDGGGTWATSDPIDNTNDDPLYQTERYGMAAYHFDVSPGTYQVTLHFAENYHRTPGRRIMNVTIEDLSVLTNLDLVQMAGHDVAISFNYPEITVSDGRLDIAFTASIDAAKISAIEISSVASMPVFAISPDTLDFGAGRDVINVSVWNAGQETMAWSATEVPETGWITGIQPSGGTLSPGVQQTLQVTVDRDGMLEGDYESLIQFVSNGGTKNVPVYMRVVGGPALTIEPKIVDFGLEEVSKSFTIANSGGGELDWSLVELHPESWLILTGATSGSLDMEQSATINVNVSRSGMSDGDYLATLAVYTQVDTQYVAVSMVVQNRAPYGARINAGGGQYTDVAGNMWTADQTYSEDGFGYVGGYNYAVSEGITNTEDDPLYQTERYGMTSYKFDVPLGQYNVALHFAEIYAKRVGLRVMDVKIEGSTVLNDLDLYAVAGHKAAIVYNF
ncbi:FG-GAP repeat protein, partial [bacterium]|nr:FG-GAP repeat protein [bacterium]